MGAAAQLLCIPQQWQDIRNLVAVRILVGPNPNVSRPTLSSKPLERRNKLETFDEQGWPESCARHSIDQAAACVCLHCFQEFQE